MSGYNENSNNFVNQNSSGANSSYTIASGLAGLNANSYLVGSSATYELSTGFSDGGATSGSELVYAGGAATSTPATISQIASDLLLLANSNSSNIDVPSNSNEALSAVEAAILRSTFPIDINETEEITVNGHRGIWANKSEVMNWKGAVPISEYEINQDSSPEVITKRTQQQVVYQQEVAIRYLRPPTPPAPGEILIQQEGNLLAAPAPPLIIRQQPPRPVTPPPLVVREAPPQPPSAVGRKVITISGKRIPPPPRKVVIERLAPLPSKPQSVIIERWLPYSQVKRRVIFQKSSERDTTVVKPKNVIIQWEAPQVLVKKDFKDLGVIRANPAEYVARYGSTLKSARELPPFVLEIKPPAGVVLAADYQFSSVYELEGDVQALRLVDLDREGLSEYKSFLQRLGITGNSVQGSLTAASASTLAVSSASIIADLFSSLDKDRNGFISPEEAHQTFLRLNNRLGRRYDENDVREFFSRLDINRDGLIDLVEFRRAYERSL